MMNEWIGGWKKMNGQMDSYKESHYKLGKLQGPLYIILQNHSDIHSVRYIWSVLFEI
jgi:hypothetical protein